MVRAALHDDVRVGVMNSAHIRRDCRRRQKQVIDSTTARDEWAGEWARRGGRLRVLAGPRQASGAAATRSYNAAERAARRVAQGDRARTEIYLGGGRKPRRGTDPKQGDGLR
jgi:hypothetical protein